MKKIALDAGHGLKTPGKQTPNGIKEWTLNDSVRDKVVDILKDYEVLIINTDNDEGVVDESLADRINEYVIADVDAFVSIHHNAYTGNWGNATGVEVYTDNNPTNSDLRLADCIYGRLVKYTGLRGRGVKRLNFFVINQNSIPAVLVEGGFMDGVEDYKVITSDAGQTAYAKAVAEGLIEFLGLKKKAVNVGLTATSLINLSAEDVIKTVGPLFTEDNKKSGILASVSLAQFILESGYGKSELAQTANNCFGMKTELSGNNWSGSTWSGDIYPKTTSEFVDGEYVSIVADFRKYKNIEDSIADHSAYLLGAMKGANKRYPGIKGCTDHEKTIQIIKDGGYATSPTYVERVMEIINKWGLAKYDYVESTKDVSPSSVLYRVQVGSYRYKAYAEAMYKKVRAAGFDAYIANVEGLYKVQVGAFSKKANADSMVKKLENTGFQAFITLKGGSVVPVNTVKSIDEIAKEVIRGEWGNGEERKTLLEAEGYDYHAVQKRVNDLI